MEKKLQTYKYIRHIAMVSSLSNLALISSKEFIKLNVNIGKILWNNWGIKYKSCGCFLECTNFKEDLIENR